MAELGKKTPPQSKKPIHKKIPDPTPLPAQADEESGKNFKEKLASTSKAIFKRLGLKHFAFIFVLVAYAFLGALIFHLIEGPEEQKQKQDLQNHLNESAKNLTVQIENAQSSEEIFDIICQYQSDSGQRPTDKQLKRNNWDFWGSMFYAGTLFTTIGYGHYAPETESGQLATMIYAVIGIPLVLATLADLGRLLTRILKTVWTHIVWAFRSCINFCKYKKRVAEELESIKTYEAEEFNLPIPIAIALFLGWLVFCAAIFKLWETEWSYFKALYFFFVSLSTIGLGDVVPEHPRFLLMSFPLVIMGLSLVTMVINLIQIKIEAMKAITAEFIEEELGWDTETESCGDENEYDDKPPDQDAPPDDTVSLGVIQTLVKRVARRKRRGVQTDESYLRDVKRRYPHTPYMRLSSNMLSKSRDDINSLIDGLEY